MTDPIAETTAGQVRGISEGGVTRFMGVPYAAAPVGELRFASPAPPPPWPDVRDATQQGPTAPQLITPFPDLDLIALVGPGWRKGDGYLNLNIWTPDISAKLPVMVFIHGGAFALGGNDAPVQDGTAFARAGVVLIGVNYRLGVDGFLPINGAPTNLGLRDQIAALQWVQANAAAFGGDPANVTVFGESAGAMSVANLLTSPLAKGLFRRAIVESGHGAMVREINVAAKVTAKVAKVLRIKPDITGFRSTTAEQCVAALVKVSQPSVRIDLRDAHGREPAFGLSKFLPVRGDDVLPDMPMAALAKGAGAEVDLLIGSNREEMNLYFVPTGVRKKLVGFLAKLILRRVEPRGAEILKAYGLGQKGQKAGDVFTRAMSDLVFRLPARKFAAAHQGRTHVYEFDWRSPACDGELGACHGMELPFVFNTLATATGPKGLGGLAPPQALADRVQKLWVDFAATGALPWGEYSAADPQVYALEAGKAEAEPEMLAAKFLPA